MKNNPVLWIWAPSGCGEEFAKNWKQAMTEALPQTLPEDSPVYPMYYPEVKEHAQCRIPNNLTFERKLDIDLGQYLSSVATWAGVDLSVIDSAINIDLATKKAFYILMELGAPAIEKMFTVKAQENMKNAQVAAALNNKIIAPPVRKLQIPH